MAPNRLNMHCAAPLQCKQCHIRGPSRHGDYSGIPFEVPTQSGQAIKFVLWESEPAGKCFVSMPYNAMHANKNCFWVGALTLIPQAQAEGPGYTVIHEHFCGIFAEGPFLVFLQLPYS